MYKANGGENSLRTSLLERTKKHKVVSTIAATILGLCTIGACGKNSSPELQPSNTPTPTITSTNESTTPTPVETATPTPESIESHLPIPFTDAELADLTADLEIRAQNLGLDAEKAQLCIDRTLGAIIGPYYPEVVAQTQITQYEAEQHYQSLVYRYDQISSYLNYYGTSGYDIDTQLKILEKALKAAEAMQSNAVPDNQAPQGSNLKDITFIYKDKKYLVSASNMLIGYGGYTIGALYRNPLLIEQAKIEYNELSLKDMTTSPAPGYDNLEARLERRGFEALINTAEHFNLH
jgi:hypothetical protein